ncbi:MAG: FtsK/SpoIIIE domain-containing protein [Planctomycetaceae bacterium]
MSSILDKSRLKSELQRFRKGIASFLDGYSRLTSERSASETERTATQQSQLAEIETGFLADRSFAQQKFDAARSEIVSTFESEYQSVSAQYRGVLNDSVRSFEDEMRAADAEHADARWMVLSVLDDQSHESPRFQFQLFRKRLGLTKARSDAQSEEVDLLVHAAREFMGRRWLRQSLPVPEEISPPNDLRELEERFSAACQVIRDRWSTLRSLTLPHLFSGWRPTLLFLIGALGLYAGIYCILAATPLGSRYFPDPSKWPNWIAGISSGTMFLVISLLLAMARSRSGEVWWDLEQADLERRACRARWGERAKRELSEQRAEQEKRYESIAAGRNRSLAKIDSRRDERIAAASTRRAEAQREAEQTFPMLLQGLVEQRDAKLKALEAEHVRRMHAIANEREASVRRVLGEGDQRRLCLESDAYHAERSLFDEWSNARDRFLSYVSQSGAESRRVSREWESMRSDHWKLPAQMPPSVRAGHFSIDINDLARGFPAQPRLLPDVSRVELPFTLPVHPCESLLLKATDAGRAAAVSTLRTMMLRILTSLPAGRVRFTVIDPVGLGEDFAAFMHLSDFNEALVGTRIWTEKSHNEKRLANLSEHMENIFQAYLRNEFSTIEEYNEHAGEVAEPYHFVVVANFPANFTEAAASRLVSIATSGARCGVHTLISVDSKLPLPHGFDLADLEAAATVLEWKQGEFVTKDPELARLRLTLDSPPPPSEFVEIVRSAGAQSKHAHRVEVPFERIAPNADSFWQKSSSAGIDVALGRAGATRLQHLKLGHGTAQHVLVAGKTGSGKSSLLHTLITNVALNYGPDEIEFYLVDFKKGVEFKAYATLELPHAKVIGIESDREFGLSVLQRLDAILQERGELFRRQGVQDIDSFRQANPSVRLPRILLVIDEFQEFFVEDDSLSQSAALLLDRLVRQGRAFGVHVLLGSQTLGGAYALARSTLGQIAVRIALQCSEADAALILSDENSAARLLSRPGEAIYNDANGLVEGNHPFQVAWLPDTSREHALKQLRSVVLERKIEPEPPVVFEGHTASDPRNNAARVDVLRSANREQSAEVDPIFWLGEPVSIKVRPHVELHRRPGSNLLVVGQDSDMALGTLAASLVALAGRQPMVDYASPVPIFVINGDARDGQTDTVWSRIGMRVPVPMRLAGQNDAAKAVGEVAEEVRRRIELGTAHAPMYLFISNLCRMRDLRNDEDDFGMSRGSSGVSAGKLLAEIFRDGPAVGVHAIVWCDTFSNMSRWFGYQTLRDFDLRVAFQMNAADSSNLIDSPAAAKLGHHRALVFHRETGVIEKIRPYSAPTAEWLAWIEEEFRQRSFQETSVSEP